MRAFAARPPGRLQAALAPDLHGYLGGRAAAAWASFGERLGSLPALRADAGLAPGTWAIEEGRG
jgi:hypothetical protein